MIRERMSNHSFSNMFNLTIGKKNNGYEESNQEEASC